MKPFSVAAIFTKNYISQARTMVASLRRFHPEAKVYGLILDSIEGYFDPKLESFDVLTFRDLGISETQAENLYQRYDPLALSCVMKSKLTKALFEKFNEECVVYADTDLYFTNAITSVISELAQNSLLLTPHRIHPSLGQRSPSELERETELLSAGIFNMGFYAIRRTKDAVAFLDWWEKRNDFACTREPMTGFYHDQKWMDAAPHFFEGVVVSKNPTLNVAHWNFDERDLKLSGKRIYCGSEPLSFFHFSRFSPLQPYRLCVYKEYSALEDPALKLLTSAYAKELSANGWFNTHLWPLSFWVTKSSFINSFRNV